MTLGLARMGSAIALGVALAAAQAHPPSHGQVPEPPRGEAPLHRPDRRLPPHLTLTHLRRANERYVAERAERERGAHGMRREHGERSELTAPASRDEPTPATIPRPAGAGTLLAVVIACADAQLDVAALLKTAASDLLVLQSLGPHPGTLDIAAIEHAAEADFVSLAVILVHEECATLGATLNPTAPLPKQQTPAQRALHERVQQMREQAARLRLPIAQCHGLRTAEQILLGSQRLETMRKAGEFALVVGVVAKSGAIHWVAPWAGGEPMVGVEGRALPTAPPAKAGR